MNNHWLVLTDHGWQSFESKQEATDKHCEYIGLNVTSYLIHGQTIDANGSDLDYALIREE